MVEQDVGERGLSFWCVKGCQINACICKSLIGWSKQSERSVALERCQQFCLNHRSNKRVVDACALSGSWDIGWRSGGGEHLVNHVNKPVACRHVGGCHCGPVDHDTVPYGEGEGVAVHGFCSHAVGHSGSWHFTRNNVVKQDICKSDFSFRRIKVCKDDSCIEERLVGWCEDGEWPVALKRFKQLCLNHTGHKRVVNSCALCRPWDVIRCYSGCEHLVDDMDHTVAGVDIGKRDCCIVHHHAITNGEGDWVAVHGGCC